MTLMKGYGVIIIDVWFWITLLFHTFVPGLREKVFYGPRKNLAGSGSSFETIGFCDIKAF